MAFEIGLLLPRTDLGISSPSGRLAKKAQAQILKNRPLSGNARKAKKSPTARATTKSPAIRFKIVGFTFLTPAKKSQWGTISRAKWDIKARGRAKYGFETSVAITIPARVCGVSNIVIDCRLTFILLQYT